MPTIAEVMKTGAKLEKKIPSEVHMQVRGILRATLCKVAASAASERDKAVVEMLVAPIALLGEMNHNAKYNPVEARIKARAEACDQGQGGKL